MANVLKMEKKLQVIHINLDATDPRNLSGRIDAKYLAR